MAIPVLNFNPLSFKQANPLLSGIEAGQNMIGKNLLNESRGIQNKYLSPQLQQTLLKTILENKLSEATLPYAGDSAAASLALKKAQLPFLNSKTALNEAQLPYIGMNANSRFLTAQAKNQSANTTLANSFRSFLQTDEGQKLALNNPKLLDALYSTMASQANQLTGQQPENISDERMQQNRDLISQAINDKYQKKNVPTQILNQRYKDQSAANMISKIAPLMPIISQFSGVEGQANAYKNQILQGMGGKGDPNYEIYKNFVNVQAPLLGNEIRAALGGQATDHEQKLISKVTNPVSWNKSPKQTLSDFNTLMKTIRANAEAISQTPGEISSSMKNEKSEIKTLSNGKKYKMINGQLYEL